MNNQSNNIPQQVPAKKYALPQSYTDFDFNIDFDTAFSNIPIDIPSSNLFSELLNGPHSSSLDTTSSLTSSVAPPPALPQLLYQPNCNYSPTAPSSPQLLNHSISNSIPDFPNATPPTVSVTTSTLLTPSLGSTSSPQLPVAAKSEASAKPLFNAQESSIISQFFEKFNADPEFIFSPKLDSRLLNLTEHDFSTPPAFQTHQQNISVKNNNNNSHQTHINAWDIPTPDIFPFVSSTTLVPPPPPPVSQINTNPSNTFTPNPTINTKVASHTKVLQNEPLQRPNPDALRKLPIKYGTDPSFQEGGFQPSYSLSSSIRTRQLSGNAPESPGFDINNFSNEPIKFDNIYNNVNHSDSSAGTAVANTDPKGKKKSSMAAKSASIVAATRRKGAEVGVRPRRENLTEDQKRMNHISSEKRRRDLIKTQFTEMCSLVPKLANTESSTSNSSKSTVLKIVYDYIVFMFEQNKLLRQLLVENHVDLSGITDSTVPHKTRETSESL